VTGRQWLYDPQGALEICDDSCWAGLISYSCSQVEDSTAVSPVFTCSRSQISCEAFPRCTRQLLFARCNEDVSYHEFAVRTHHIILKNHTKIRIALAMLREKEHSSSRRIRLRHCLNLLCLQARLGTGAAMQAKGHCGGITEEQHFVVQQREITRLIISTAWYDEILIGETR
jgi:hypothetical protein